MARLDDLSTELILDIFGRIPPEDLQSTTFISKTVYPIARALLDQHRDVLAQQYEDWSDVVTIDEAHPLYHCTHMHAGLLCTILTDRRLAQMVKTLGFFNPGPLFGDESEVDLESAWRPEGHFPGSLHSLRKSQHLAQGSMKKRIQILEEALYQCTILTQDQRETWLKKLHRGSEELATCLLLWHLPALRVLVLHLDSPEWTDVYAFLLRLVEYAFTGANLPAPAQIVTRLPLQDLDTVYLSFEEPRSEDVALVRVFLTLPRVSSLSCQGLSFSSVRMTTSMQRPAEASAIDSLEFSACTVDSAELSEVLEGVATLRQFTYTWLETDTLNAHDWLKFGPPAIVSALAESIRHSIEELDLCAWVSPEDQRPCSSIHFRDFHALKDLKLTTNIMYGRESSNLSSFVLMLPKGLQSLTLRWIKRAPVPEIRIFSTFLTTFANEARIHLTSLREISVLGYLDVDEMEELPAEDVETGRRTIGHLELSIHSNEVYR